MKPSISVIIPTYNGEDFIDQALDSINRQTVPVDEIIVVDDGSTDRTESIVKNASGPVRFFRQAHTGMPTAGRNRGLTEARGEYIAFLDQDDWWPPEKIEIQLTRMNLPQQPDVVMGKTMISSQTEDPLQLKKRYGNNHIFLLSAALFRKSAFDRVGLFDENLHTFGTDTDWFMRSREKNLLILLHHDIVLYWRRHGKNQLSNLKDWRSTIAEIMKISILRRKKDGIQGIKALPKFRIITEKDE